MVMVKLSELATLGCTWFKRQLMKMSNETGQVEVAKFSKRF